MKTLGIIGYPLGHSFSKEFFTEKFKDEQVEAEYLNFEIKKIEELPAILEGYPNLCGLNVTIPYKEKVLAYLDEIDPGAQEIGAVNCIRIEQRAGKKYLIGYNTDVFGFSSALMSFTPTPPKKALILGNGGAAKAVRYLLNAIGTSNLTVSRNPRQQGEIAYEDVPAYIDSHKLIVNTTPLGMYPNTDTYPPIPYDRLTSSHYLFDLVYNPTRTEFMKRGEKYGASAQNGSFMLLKQALACWKIWEL